jgi:plastocyanin
MKTNYTFGGVLLLALLLFSNTGLYATRFIVSVENFKFDNANLTEVHVGDTIRWEWVSGTHTTTSTTIPGDAATWDHLITSSSTFYEYKVTVAGTYNYKCTPHESMGMVGSFTASLPSGLSETNSDVRISLFPNPVRSTGVIQYHSDSKNLSLIRIFDLTGKIIYEQKSESAALDQSIPVDLSELTPGIYFASFTSGQDKPVVIRLIKE